MVCFEYFYKQQIDWQLITKKEQTIILQLLAVLVASDPNLGSDAVKRFGSEVQVAEARAFFGFQMMQSNIHSELFNVILEMLSKDAEETSYLFETIGASKLCPT
jgi:ribonucleotide reductase beta subunit family protein with ferritin-like domain